MRILSLTHTVHANNKEFNRVIEITWWDCMHCAYNLHAAYVLLCSFTARHNVPEVLCSLTFLLCRKWHAMSSATWILIQLMLIVVIGGWGRDQDMCVCTEESYWPIFQWIHLSSVLKILYTVFTTNTQLTIFNMWWWLLSLNSIVLGVIVNQYYFCTWILHTIV